MHTPEANTVAVYKNIMELLVEEEVERQLDRIPPQKAAYYDELEITAYALNQLPALYATNEKGLDYQLQRGRAKLGAQITQAVQRALIAVQRDPIAGKTPLKAQQFSPFEDILTQLRALLQEDHLDWETLPHSIDRALKRASRDSEKWGEKWRDNRSTPSSSAPASVPAIPLKEHRHTAFTSATSHTNLSDRHIQPHIQPHIWYSASAQPTTANQSAKSATETTTADPTSTDSLGWDNPLYQGR